jgi:hypothetical protein
MVSARGKRFLCFGGEAEPHAHDKIWIDLPLHFEEPTHSNMAELHDRLLGLFPEGGSHKWREVQAVSPPEAQTADRREVISVPVSGSLLDRLDAYCSRSSFTRTNIIRSLLEAVFNDDQERGLAVFNSWSKDAREKIRVMGGGAKS